VRSRAVVVVAICTGVLSGCGDGGSDGPPPSGTLDFQVNVTTAGDQRLPAIVALTGGEVVVAWRHTPPGGGVADVRARAFASDLSGGGDEIVVTPPGASSSFLRSLAPLADGGFVVVWAVGTQSFARRYGADGEPGGDVYEIEGGVGSARAVDGVGRVVVAREETCEYDGEYGVESFGCIRARRTEPDGTLTQPSFQVNEPNYNYAYYLVDQERPSVAASTGGRFVVVWSEEDWYYGHHGNYDHPSYARAFDESAAPLGAAERVANSGYLAARAAADMNAGGDFVVVTQYCSGEYESYDRSCYYAGIGGSRTSASGDTRSFNVVAQVGYDGREHEHDAPAAGINAVGQFVVVWRRTGYETDQSDIMARLYDPNATATTAGYEVNADAPGQRCCADAARLDDGGVVVVWQSDGEDGDGAGIFARRLP
jgi:hypothetical protein